jgi:transcriptional regulator with XRE-family HTH domain
MSKTFEDALGVVMRASRKASKKTLADVAREMGCIAAQVEVAESGKVVITSEVREAFCNAVGITEGELLKRAWQTHDLFSSIKPLRGAK